nr:50S ribosomal protein L13 [Nesterenkonia massiliensis]
MNRRRPTVRHTNVRTYTPKNGDADAQWHIIDATDVVLGRLASQAATLLRGKHKPTFAPHQDMGDFVIIINAEKVAVTGDKVSKKRYWRHSGFPGGIKSITFGDMIQRYPTRAVEQAVKGMLPHNKLGAAQLKKLRVYAGAEHPHAAQQPKPFEISQVAQ